MDIYEEIESLLSRLPDSCIAGPKPERMVQAAEQRLGLQLPASFRGYLLKFGNVSVRSLEFYGLTLSDDFDNENIPNFVWYTLRCRETAGIPPEWIIFLNDNGDQLVGIDTSQQLANGDNPVIILDRAESTMEALALGFADYLADSLLEVIENEGL